jgi:dTDP-4-dehydrorhamnose reductase
MRVAIIGANGQLGSDLCAAYTRAGHDVVPLNHAELDIRDAAGVQRVLASVTPQVVVNSAAMHNVENCEADPASAFGVNAIAVRTLAHASRELDFALAHVSTDYVFRGDSNVPYVETDVAYPLNVYGNSKLSGEHFLQAIAPRYFVVRTSALFGLAPCRAKPSGNFVQIMLKLARERGEVRVVDDEVVSPTYTADLAEQIVHLTASGRPGVYHATSQGAVSWFDYAKAVFEIAGVTVRMDRASTRDFPQKAPRPAYSVLENAALKSQGIDIMPAWRDAVERYLAAAALPVPAGAAER